MHQMSAGFFFFSSFLVFGNPVREAGQSTAKAANWPPQSFLATVNCPTIAVDDTLLRNPPHAQYCSCSSQSIQVKDVEDAGNNKTSEGARPRRGWERGSASTAYRKPTVTSQCDHPASGCHITLQGGGGLKAYVGSFPCSGIC